MTIEELYTAVKALVPQHKVRVSDTLNEDWRHWSVMVSALPTCSCGKEETVASVHICRTAEQAYEQIADLLEGK